MLRRIIFFALLTLVSTNLFAAYEIVERFMLNEDRLKTMEMLRPYGHDFIFNLGVALNPDVLDTIDDAKKISKTSGGAAAKLTAGQEFLTKHNNEEFMGRFDLHFGIPLPSFTISGIKFTPDLRFGTNIGAQVGTVAVPLTAASVVDLLGPDIPQAVVGAVVARYDSLNAGDELLTAAECTLIFGAGADCSRYKKPTNPDIADLFAYVKYETRFGAVFNATKGNYFGSFNPYLRHRADLSRRYTADFIAAESKLFEKDELIDFVDLAFDIMFGYKKKNWKVYAKIEEIKATEIKKNLVLDGTKYTETFYGNNILLRLHGDYTFNIVGMKLTPFGGIHKRSGYDFVDGLYAGADVGWSFWKDRFGLLAKTMFDSQYITIAPRITLWVMQLELMSKIPHQSKDGNIKLPNVYSLNFRLFF